MTRRHALRHTMLLGVGMALGKLDALHASGGELTVDLNQWHHVTFRYQGRVVVVPVGDIFLALKGGE